MIACLILGMGLPTTATYIVLVTMAVPALAQMHLPYEGMLVGAIALLPIHMFVLYYGVLADVTPPVALAAYAASGIAKSNQFWTGVEAFKISLNKLMVPFAFVYSPSILLLGINWASPMSLGGAAFDISTMFIGILALHASVIGLLADAHGQDRADHHVYRSTGTDLPERAGSRFRHRRHDRQLRNTEAKDYVQAGRVYTGRL